MFAGKLLADMGAEVIKVERPEGDPTRAYPPFLDDEPGLERSLYFWHYNTSKLSVTLDLTNSVDRKRLSTLIDGTDILIQSGEVGADLEYAVLQKTNAGLIMVTLSPFGQEMPRQEEAATDLTILAGGGPVWNCGYDDHSLPPVRGGGNQGYHTASHFAVMSALVALLYRDETDKGQHIEVNAHAAANVTTEAGTYTWLVAQETVERQTGRHAAVNPSMPVQVLCKDGRYVNTGIPPRRPDSFSAVCEWLETLGLTEEFLEFPLLEQGSKRARFDMSMLQQDQELMAIFGAGRSAMNFLASRLTAYEFFVGGQQRGFQTGIIYSPEEVLEDPHFIERGFPVEVEHPELARTFTYPGAPYQFHGTPWRIRRRAPLLGEDNGHVFAEAKHS
tara:strand:- start:3604 stop:4770 length:1167 start_codon:yes stop_codon:yes gene_type:complete